MNKKIAFFDIDGTLIDVPHGLMKPTDKTIYALKKFQKQGHKIVIATARGRGLKSVEDIEFDGYICNDGHFISFDNEILVEELFKLEDIEKLLEVYEKYNGRSMFSGYQKMWCAYLDDELIKKHQAQFNVPTDENNHLIEEFSSQDVQAIASCVLFDTVEELKNAYNELKDDFTIVPYEKGLIRMDVYRKGFKKGTACEYLYKKLGFDFEDTYAFGDGINDKEMFQLTKHSVAMGNAIDELKDMASEVTDTVMNEGIAKYFSKHFDINND